MRVAETWFEKKAATRLNCIVMLLSVGEILKYDFCNEGSRILKVIGRGVRAAESGDG